MWLIPLLALACSSADPPGAVAPPAQEPTRSAPAPAPPPSPPEPEPVVERVSLAAVGDVLPHRAVKATGRELGWPIVFADVAPLVSAADIAFANLESPVAPDAHTGTRGEVFNAPAEMLPALGDAGFDVLSMANNHVYDQGVEGMIETRRRVSEAGMATVGTGETCAAARAAHVVEVRGVRVAFLAVADLSNIDKNSTPDAACAFFAGPVCTTDCGVDRDAIYYSPDIDAIIAAVSKARESADFVVLSFHWGNEYRTTPLPEYPPLAQRLIDEGVDVLLGHHAHVLQPVVQHTAPDGRQGVIAYGLGNFVSNMAANYDFSKHSERKGNTRDAILLNLSFVKGPGDARTIEGITATPLWTDNNQNSRADGPTRVVVSPHAAVIERADPEQRTDVVAMLTRRREIVAGIVGEQWVSGP